jgi:hypothetical protein
VDNNNREIVSETHPLIYPLCERLERWRGEIGQTTYPRLQQGFVDALEVTKKAGVGSELVIFAVALCEYWFRICRPTKEVLKLALSHRLTDPRYSPHSSTSAGIFTTTDVPHAVNQHIDRYLAERWESEASKAMNEMFRSRFLNEKNRLALSLRGPFLVSEFLSLPGRRGGYPDWGPWVAATVVYRSAILHSLTEQDSKPLEAAEAVIEVLRGNRPDKSAFHRKRREIRERAPKLVEAILRGYQRAKTMIVQDKRILPLIDEDCFPSLRQQGGWSLLVGNSSSRFK